MVIEMRRNDIACHIIGRMLDRRKGMYFLSVRKNDDSSGMLSGRTLYSDTSGNYSVDFTVPFTFALFLEIFFDISVHCLVGKRTYRSGFKCLTLAENNLDVGMGFCLIFTGEIKIDIRLLVTVESQECLERNVKPFFI